MLRFATLCIIVVAFIACVSCHGWQRFGFWKQRVRNFNCRLTHQKTVLDERGHMTGCVSRCGLNYEERYSWKYGHYCKKLPEGCAIRSCMRCLSGYKQLKLSYRRSRCVKRCPRRYVEKNRKCIETPRGCKDLSCSACLNGYFFFPKPLYFGTKCRTRCPIGYEGNRTTNECERKNIKEGCADYYCYRCEKGYYKLNEDFKNRCVSSCPDGFGPMNGICREIPTGCKTANCSECKDFYFHYEKAIFFQACRRSCPVGYYEDNVKNKCISCKTDSCSECSTAADWCEKCRRPKALLVKRNSNAIKTSCVYRCPSGYRKIFDYERVMRVCDKINKEPKKEVKPEGCVDSSCLQCKSGYYRLTVGFFGPRCVPQCPTGYFTGRSECFACSEPRCAVCMEGLLQCKVCKQGYITMPQIANETVTCLTQCPKGFISMTQNGTTTCEREGTPACAINNCEECASHEVHSFHAGCKKCMSGYLLKRNIFQDECVASCPNGFFAGVKPGTSVKACLNCGVPFCKACVNRKKCLECHEPFVINFKSGRCSLCETGTVYNRTTKSCKPVKGLVSIGVPVESIIN